MTEIAMTCDVHFNQWEEDTLDYFVNEKGFQRIHNPGQLLEGTDGGNHQWPVRLTAYL